MLFRVGIKRSNVRAFLVADRGFHQCYRISNRDVADTRGGLPVNTKGLRVALSCGVECNGNTLAIKLLSYSFLREGP